jgi:SAM-dependent methyltransferase
MTSRGLPATERFSDRVADYVRYRPSYPAAAIDALVAECGLASGDVAADVGAGTGLFTRLLLDRGLLVTAVEPNAGMRKAAEEQLSSRTGFTSVTGTAEQTGLADASVDLVSAAQAFHWFRPRETRREFRRILRADGSVALIWNNRRDDLPLHQEYDAILRAHAPEYVVLKHTNLDDTTIAGFFTNGACRTFAFPNPQRLDREAFLGRMLSASYTPPAGTPGRAALVAEAERLFEHHQNEGRVDFDYLTRLFIGRP